MGRQRQHRVEICLSDKEHRHLKKQMAATGLSCAALLRRLVLGLDIRPRPPEEWPELVRQVSAIGNNINQIVRVANSEKKVEPQVLHEVMRLQAAVWERVKNL